MSTGITVIAATSAVLTEKKARKLSHGLVARIYWRSQSSRSSFSFSGASSGTQWLAPGISS